MRGNGHVGRPDRVEDLDPSPRLGCRNALLLQGPNGPFFARLAKDLRASGATTTKVNFNVADSLFYRGTDVIAFRDEMRAWPDRLRAIMIEKKIDAVFLFGDQRPIHVVATKLARELGIKIWVFEEGYLRPDYVTCERDGVNGNSLLPRDPEHYRTRSPLLPDAPPVTPVGDTFWLHTLWTILASIGKTFGWFRYPKYVHHRRTDAFYGAFCYTRGAFRKLRYRITEKGVVERVIAKNDGKYFVLPLQVYCDAQLQHSDFPSMEAMMTKVIETFAAAAPNDAMLVVKHHPHDVPFRDYRSFLNKLAARHGLGDRVVYIHDTHLPTLLKHARGVVTMNSTVGPSALFHHTPVKVLGRATYDIPGMTAQVPLAEFFAEPGKVDGELFDAYTKWLRVVNQVNGSFYRRVGRETATGLPSALFDRAVPVAKDDAAPVMIDLAHDSGPG